jgi:hypothetical protein
VVFSHYSREQSSQDADTATANVGEADISSLLEMLGSVMDPRKERGRQHEVDFVLAVCVVATLAGAGSRPPVLHSPGREGIAPGIREPLSCADGEGMARGFPSAKQVAYCPASDCRT